MALVGSIEKVRGSRMAIRRGAEAGHDADDHPHQHPMARYRRLTGDSATEKP